MAPEYATNAEALAEARCAQCGHPVQWHRTRGSQPCDSWPGGGDVPCECRLTFAEALLASDWMRQHDDAVRAEGWSEGHLENRATIARHRERAEAAENALAALQAAVRELIVQRDYWLEPGVRGALNAALTDTTALDRATREARAEALEPVLALHRPDGGTVGPGAMCVECTRDFGTPAEDPAPYPCATVRAARLRAGGDAS